ncbi:alpha-glucuronidase family glycosyl hydrolase [Thalassobacillus pellis]|uniref:alpha-glucuronidase family glycosyl hydrolase n=1 Tax=Thalassobacillus pellis TaxID=748008 RepID=UPI001960DFDC|nr:alpha-glucuronidase family glycosyl hydrolase [Thalassobacillus pellis]MBM7551554.1 alpha-glucuronidase [Thalassobacillus pellis]
MNVLDKRNNVKDFDFDPIYKTSYEAWLGYRPISGGDTEETYRKFCGQIISLGNTQVIKSAMDELKRAFQAMLDVIPEINNTVDTSGAVVLGAFEEIEAAGYELGDTAVQLNDDGFRLKTVSAGDTSQILVIGKSDKGVLYGTFHLLRLMQMEAPIDKLDVIENPANQLRMINEWDNMDGSIERGYAGRSIFYEGNEFTNNLGRIKDYARLLSSIGINAIAINNVNVHAVETELITKKLLPDVKQVADIFRAYGIKTFLSINYASPIQLGNLDTADPLNEKVREWWREKTKEIYDYIPDFGGYVVKADSEHRPGPFTYNRNHADGANMLAEALQPFDGIVFWRCFVYNCLQDWRDRSTDRAKAAYDHFKPLDGEFLENVVLQIKNGPMDFQVREPVSPLFGGLEATNHVLEFQVTQEYTGQQKHLCYLIPQWKEILDFDTYARGEGSTVKKVVSGEVFGNRYSGITAVSNIGRDMNWTGHPLAQANFYGYGRLIWNPKLTAESISEEWIKLTFGTDSEVVETISKMLLDSWSIYESYTAPLGVGWMVNPSHHYGPNVDGYEYSVWGTYHFADCHGIGVDRTVASGTGYTAQYFPGNAEIYESLEKCPDELLLFFHHVPYTHQLKSGETVIQHIYNTHFEGVERVNGLIEQWESLKGKIDEKRYEDVAARLDIQKENAKDWRDIINTYFYRKSGIDDTLARTIY